MRVFRLPQASHAYAYGSSAFSLTTVLCFSPASAAVDVVSPGVLIDSLAREASLNRSYAISSFVNLQLGSFASGELLTIAAITGVVVIIGLLVMRFAKRKKTLETATAPGQPSQAANRPVLLQSKRMLAGPTDGTATNTVWLVSEKGKSLAAPFERIASPDGCIVGRTSVSDIAITDNTVSKRHARLSFDALQRLVIEDLGSANGSWKNGVRISRETISSGDTVWFGNAKFTIDILDNREADTTTAVQAGVTNVNASEPGRNLSRPLVLSGIDQDGRVIQFFLPAALEERVWTVGRKSGRADLVLPDQRISATHAQIRYRPGHGFEICDLNSANGTTADGQDVGQDYVPLLEVRKISFGGIQLNANLG